MQKQDEHKSNGWVVFMRVWAMTLYLPLRRRMGREHVGFSLIPAFLLIWVVASYAKAPSLTWLFAVDVIAWIFERVGQEIRRWRGTDEHSLYEGDSWLFGWLVGDAVAKRICEPLLSFFIGWLFFVYSPEPNAASYFWYGGLALIGVQTLGNMQERRVDAAMRNAMIERQWYAQRMRRRL